MNQNEQMLREALRQIKEYAQKCFAGMAVSVPLICAIAEKALAATPEPSPLVRLTEGECKHIANQSFVKYAGWKFEDALYELSKDLQDAWIAKNGGKV